MVIFWYCNFKNMIIKRFFHALGNCNNIELSGEKQKKEKIVSYQIKNKRTEKLLEKNRDKM